MGEHEIKIGDAFSRVDRPALAWEVTSLRALASGASMATLARGGRLIERTLVELRGVAWTRAHVVDALPVMAR